MRLILRRAAGNLAILAVTVMVVALTAGVTAAATRLVAQITAEGLQTTLSAAPLATRGLTAMRTFEGAAANATSIDSAGRRLHGELERPLRGITTAGTAMVDLPRFVAADPPSSGRQRLFTLRVQPGFDAYAQVVAGRLPRSDTDRVAIPPALQEAARGSDQPDATVVEVALTQATAAALRLEVGDTVILEPHAQDPYVTRFLTSRPLIAVRVSGIVALDDPARPVWFGDRSAHEPTLISEPGGGSVTVFATVLAAPGSLGRLADAISPIPVVASWRYPVDPAVVRPEDVTGIQQALRRLEQRYPSTSYVPAGSIAMRTGLGQVLDRFVTARASALSAVSIAGAGLAGVALAVIVLLAFLRAADRHDLDLLLRARGASRVQMTGAAICEAVIVTVTGAVCGLAVAQFVGRSVPHAGRVGVLSAAAVSALLLVPIAPAARAARATSPSHPGRRASLSRVTVEVAVVVVAVAGAILFRRRGVIADGAGADPFLLAVPILLGVAVGLALLRLQPLVVGALAERVAARRSTVTATGLRRAARQPSATALPVLAVTLAVATSVLTAAIDTTVVTELDRQAWMTVGAPGRLDAPPGGTLAPGGPGAPAYVQERVGSRGGGDVTLLAIAARDYADLVAGTPVATDVSALFDTTTRPLPAVTSPDAIGDVGATGELNLPGTAIVPIAVHAIRERFPALSGQEPFVVVPYEALAQVVPGGLQPNRRYLPAGVASAEGRPLTRAQVASDLMADPLVAAGLAAFRTATVLAGGLAVLAVVVSLVLAARARRRELAYLRTIGLSRRQGVGLLVAEVLPPLVVAIGVGVGLGVAVVRLLGPGLQLGVMTGGASLSPREDLIGAVRDGMALAVVVTIATLWAGWSSQRVDLSQTLRTEQR